MRRDERQVLAQSKTGLSAGEAAFHWLMIVATFGIWWPVYAARKHHANRITTTYGPRS